MSETISRPFTFVKDGVFYFSRRIPKELKNHYMSNRNAHSLRTKSPKIAEARARRAATPCSQGRKSVTGVTWKARETDGRAVRGRLAEEDHIYTARDVNDLVGSLLFRRVIVPATETGICTPVPEK